MRYALSLLALAASTVATPVPQGVSEPIAPDAGAPSGCSPDYSGTFQISAVNVTSGAAKRDVEKRQTSGVLTLTLEGGILVDQADRTGYVASNFQFQFDAPPQAGAIYTAGFSACANNTLALGGSAIWYQCYTGGFYNLYDRDWADQCSPIYLQIINGGGTGGGEATQLPDGQPGVSTILPPITELPDGQPNVPTDLPITQIDDGQIQVPTGAPITQIADGQPQAPTGAPITQIADGQPQAPTGLPPVSQIPDGQPQVPTGLPPVSQIPDGQPQVPTGGAPAPNATFSAPPIATGAAPTAVYQMGAVAAGLMGFLAML